VFRNATWWVIINVKIAFPKFVDIYLQYMYTVQKTRQISEKIREEVPWRENFPVIRGNDDYFPRITGKFSLQGTSFSLPTKIRQIFGTVYSTLLAGLRYF
jgi:hypothetical protein